MAAGPPLKQLVVLAGGFGTRLAREVGADVPKPMARVAGKPVLEHQLELAARHGFHDVRLLTHHRSEAIRRHFGDGSRLGIAARYHVEREPLGTAGAVLDALPELGDRFVVLYGDTLLDVDLDRFWRHHHEHGADVSLFVHPNDHPYDSDLVESDEAGWVRAFHPHPRPPDCWLPNRVNAALYVIERRALEPYAPPPAKQDFAHDLFPRMLADGARIHAYRSREYIKDMGTPERLARVEADLRSGLVERLSLRHPATAVFLDRDGTLNEEVNRVRALDQLRLLEGAGEAVRRLNRAGLLAVVVTNQPVVARGDCTEQELARIHAKLETLLGESGAYLDGLYHCPHHPDRGFPGERPELKIRCACRKPGTALLERASRELGIRVAGSWMVGDTSVDVQTARNAGLRAVLVRTGHGGTDRRHPVRPDYEFYDLAEAVDFVLDRHPALLELARERAGGCRPGALVAVGGLARSGKTLFASALAEALAERGQRAVTVPLDAWLRSAGEREPGHVLGRFDVAGIEQAVARLDGRTAEVSLPVLGYDRMERRRFETGEVLHIQPDDVVILEGVPALAIEPLRRAAVSTFYVEVPEPVRRARFEREYRWRGLSEPEIEALYREREADEHAFIRECAERGERIPGEIGS